MSKLYLTLTASGSTSNTVAHSGCTKAWQV